MSYCAAIELFGAIENGRFDSDLFYNMCNRLALTLDSIPPDNVTWFVDIYTVYAESTDEESLFQWVSKLCAYNTKDNQEDIESPWIYKGIILDGKLGVKKTKNGLVASHQFGAFAELKAYLNKFQSIGVKVGYVPTSENARKFMFTNVFWTGHKDVPYGLFTDVKPVLAENMELECISKLATLATNTARYSRTWARHYISAITRILINSNDIELDKVIEILSKSRSVDGIELAGLVLINHVYREQITDSNLSNAMLSFPRLGKLCTLLEDKHAFPVGIVEKG
ncbi:hypothetical protein L1D59_23470, partial [Pseudoalteromonas piscicida]|uniref:hypothetical protein n=2 Tax=Pseudoalteromonas TaxID=53246 RepID=UPI001EFCAB0A